MMFRILIAGLIMTSSALGARLNVEGPDVFRNGDGSFSLIPDFAGHCRVTLRFVELGDLAIIGSSLRATVVPTNKVRLISRTDINPKITDPTDGAAAGKYLENVIDLGYTPAGGNYPGPGGDRGESLIATYELAFEGPPFNASITLEPVVAIDANLNDNFLPSVVIGMPEPASLCLLAMGAVIRFRHRRLQLSK